MKEQIKEDWQTGPDKKYRFFLYVPDNDGMMFFKAAEERDRYFESIKDSYLNDCWDEEIENIVAGEATHTVEESNHKDRPDNLDEDDNDEDGNYWSDWAFVCDYRLIAMSSQEEEEASTVKLSNRVFTGLDLDLNASVDTIETTKKELYEALKGVTYMWKMQNIGEDEPDPIEQAFKIIKKEANNERT